MDTTILRALRDQPLARNLTEEELGSLAGHARIITYQRGPYLFHESQPRRAFGVVLRGRVQIQKGPPSRPQVLYVLDKGASYGESSLLDEYPHSTSGVAIEDAEVLEIPREVFERLSTEQPPLYSSIQQRSKSFAGVVV